MSGLSAEQLAVRRTGLGSSDLADIVLGNGLRTWLDKTGQRAPEEKPATLQGRQPMLWGARLEPLLLAAYHEETGAPLSSPGTLHHPHSPIALATPDALANYEEARVVVEAKTAGLRVGDRWDDDAIPDGYQIQGQWIMGVASAALGAPLLRCDFPVLIGGQDFQIRRMDFRPADFSGLVEIAERWWRDHVVANKPPPVDGSDAWSDYLAERFPRETKGLLLDPTPEAEAEVALIRGYVQAKKLAEEAEKAARNRLRMLVGEAEGIEGLCTLKTTKGSSYTVTRKPGRTLRLAREE